MLGTCDFGVLSVHLLPGTHVSTMTVHFGTARQLGWN